MSDLRRSHMSERKPGRPAGTPSEMSPPVADLQARSRCPKCGSDRRTQYWSKLIQAFAGTLPGGRRYRRIVRRRCRCLDCGQVRIDREYE